MFLKLQNCLPKKIYKWPTRYSASLVIREMHIKTTTKVNYNWKKKKEPTPWSNTLHPLGWLYLKKKKKTNKRKQQQKIVSVGEDMEKLGGPLYIAGRNVKSASVESTLMVSQKAKHRMTMWVSNSTDRWYLKELKTDTQINTCTLMFLWNITQL